MSWRESIMNASEDEITINVSSSEVRLNVKTSSAYCDISITKDDNGTINYDIDSDAGSSGDSTGGFSIVTYDNEPKTFNKLVKKLNKLSSKTKQRDLIIDYIEGNYKTNNTKKIILIILIVLFFIILPFVIFSIYYVIHEKRRMGKYNRNN